jgi:hypothetical protein
MRVVYSAPTFDPLLGTAPPSSALMGKSIEAPTALTTSEKDAWERLRSDPNATLANLNPTEREEWMLKLPDGGQKHALDYDAMQQSITSFSRKGAVKHAVDATWGESPADKAKREASTDAPKSSLELAKQMVAERLAREKAEQTAKTIEEYNVCHLDLRNISDFRTFWILIVNFFFFFFFFVVEASCQDVDGDCC